MKTNTTAKQNGSNVAKSNTVVAQNASSIVKENKVVSQNATDVEVEKYGGKTGDLTVYSIRITSEEGKTNEGIGLYDLIEDAIQIYGNNYKRNDNKYEYIRGNSSLVFITQNDIIISIEYLVKNI